MRTSKASLARRITRAVVGGAVACVLLTGCSDQYPLGVTLSDGQAAIIYPQCAHDWAQKVQITDDGENVYWSILATRDAAVHTFTVGVAPDGYVTVIHLFRGLPADTVLWAEVFGHRTGDFSAQSFKLEDLVEGQTWFSDKNGSVEGLEESARSTPLCGAPRLSPGQIVAIAAVVVGLAATVVLGERKRRRDARRSQPASPSA